MEAAIISNMQFSPFSQLAQLIKYLLNKLIFQIGNSQIQGILLSVLAAPQISVLLIVKPFYYGRQREQSTILTAKLFCLGQKLPLHGLWTRSFLSMLFSHSPNY